LVSPLFPFDEKRVKRRKIKEYWHYKKQLLLVVSICDGTDRAY